MVLPVYFKEGFQPPTFPLCRFTPPTCSCHRFFALIFLKITLSKYITHATKSQPWGKQTETGERQGDGSLVFL
jgi:hypothetical protein